jgi:hypothetical protein
VKRVALAFAVLLLHSCACNPPPPPPGCGATCLGCCNESGLCESGLLPAACGANGQACLACAAGVECTQGTCAVLNDGPYPCGSKTCGGKQDNLCINGQCTCGGFSPCPDGTACMGESCVCDGTTCDGCCVGGTCIHNADQTPSACGAGGASCFDCADAGADGCSSQGLCTCSDQPACDPGRACINGQCDCDPVTCADGCCQNRQCVHPDAQGTSACGSGGAVCGGCAPGLADGCAGGFCACGGNAACELGEACRDGKCVCDSASCGTGCCAAGGWCVPQPQQDDTQCGPPGGACIACPGVAQCLGFGCDCQGHLTCGAASIGAGDDFTCGVTASGLLRCWGAALDGGSDVDFPATFPLPNTATAVAVGSGFGCALTSVGVECFGATALGSYSRFEQLSAGAHHVCAIKAGQVFCWGDDSAGQLGFAFSDGGFLGLPAVVTSVTGSATRVAAGAAHTCAVVDGQVQCWGQISAPPSFDAGVVALASGDGVSCAAVPSQVVCWGRASPAVGTFALDAVALSVGSDFACAVLRSGKVQCWGLNDHGQLGAPDAGMLSDVVQATAVSCGRAHACAIALNLQVWCWGEGAHDKLGIGMSGDQAFPWPVSD